MIHESALISSSSEHKDKSNVGKSKRRISEK